MVAADPWAGWTLGSKWFVPGLMEALNPGKDERHGSTEGVPR